MSLRIDDIVPDVTAVTVQGRFPHGYAAPKPSWRIAPQTGITNA
jgi:hypothetical protein